VVHPVCLNIPVEPKFVNLDWPLHRTLVHARDSHTPLGVWQQLVDTADGKEGCGVHGHQCTDGQLQD